MPCFDFSEGLLQQTSKIQKLEEPEETRDHTMQDDTNEPES
jgi:hypothetical protein